MLIDKLRVNLKAGDGGDGYVSFGIDRKPSGGDGGRGGGVYLEGTTSIYDLTRFTQDKELSAGNGAQGGSERKQGKYGDDLIIKVPLTTYVYDSHGHLLLEIDKAGERKQLLKGGRGGLGNFNFRSGQVATLHKFTRGNDGEKLKCILELQLQADVIFIGLPNAGKSSMLNSLTNASVRVAPYPFTTLVPHLGVCGNFILMDLPGLIEGASEGKGMGTRFVRHAKNARLVAHFVNLESSDPVADYKLIRQELQNISPEIFALPEVVLLSKSDTVEPDVVEAMTRKLVKYNKDIVVTSAYLPESISRLQNVLRDKLSD